MMRLAEHGLLPDFIIRNVIRTLLRSRLAAEGRGGVDKVSERKRALLEELRSSPIALHTAVANEQHYMVPARFFELFLGPNQKYSSCLWGEKTRTLAEAEVQMLELTAARATIEDGMRILDLGCGWGSFSRYAARRFPNCRITAVSNSSAQREFIKQRCREERIENLEVVTSDINDFQPAGTFDRIVSVEMFEHLRNFGVMFERIANWLEVEGKLFVHIFTHREFAYPFETEGATNWMGRYFFTGGLMPSDDLLLHFQDRLVLEDHWRLSGVHYQRTLESWLERLDAEREAILAVLRSAYGGEAKIWLQRWRMFLIACAELFGFRGGREWGVSHYRFRRR